MSNMRKKFEGIPTEPLALDMPPSADKSAAKTKRKATRVAAWGRCPKHADFTSQRGTALDIQGDHLVWRAHTYKNYAGASMPCIASGQPLCEMPSRDGCINGTPVCSC